MENVKEPGACHARTMADAALELLGGITVEYQGRRLNW